jgi:hypothetical protein
MKFLRSFAPLLGLMVLPFGAKAQVPAWFGATEANVEVSGNTVTMTGAYDWEYWPGNGSYLFAIAHASQQITGLIFWYYGPNGDPLAKVTYSYAGGAGNAQAFQKVSKTFPFYTILTSTLPPLDLASLAAGSGPNGWVQCQIGATGTFSISVQVQGNVNATVYTYTAAAPCFQTVWITRY